MPKGKPTKPAPCTHCGTFFVRGNSRDRFCSTRCKLLGNTDKDGPVHPYRTELGRCWVWTAGNNGKGYGLFWVNGKNRTAPQVAYELFIGPIPEHDSYHGLCVCHSCDNPSCVNPAHLFLETNAGNMEDKMRKDRHGCTKLPAPIRREIQRLYASSKRISTRKLARVFGVGKSAIAAIVRNVNRKPA